jgi:hypothetical protein
MSDAQIAKPQEESRQGRLGISVKLLRDPEGLEVFLDSVLEVTERPRRESSGAKGLRPADRRPLVRDGLEEPTRVLPRAQMLRPMCQKSQGLAHLHAELSRLSVPVPGRLRR